MNNNNSSKLESEHNLNSSLRKEEITKENHNNISNISYSRDNIKNKNSSSQVVPGGSKIITKKIIREVIDDIYNSKVAFDKRSSDNKVPKETMEEYMYTYLNQKYGLKVNLKS